MNLPEAELLQLIRSNIKMIRTARRLSPADVFIATTIDIEKFENDSCEIELPELEKLCSYYEVPMSEFFRSMEHAAENN